MNNPYTEGNEVVPFNYDAAAVFSDGYAVVQTGDKYGLIDTTGKTVLVPIFDELTDYSGAAIGKETGDILLYKVGGDGFPVLPYDSAGAFNDGLAYVTSNGKYGFINSEGVEVIPLKYDSVSSFNGGYAVVMLGEENILIDTEGNEVALLPENITYTSISDGMILAGATLEGGGERYGYIALPGTETVQTPTSTSEAEVAPTPVTTPVPTPTTTPAPTPTQTTTARTISFNEFIGIINSDETTVEKNENGWSLVNTTMGRFWVESRYIK